MEIQFYSYVFQFLFLVFHMALNLIYVGMFKRGRIVNHFIKGIVSAFWCREQYLPFGAGNSLCLLVQGKGIGKSLPFIAGNSL